LAIPIVFDWFVGRFVEWVFGEEPWSEEWGAESGGFEEIEIIRVDFGLSKRYRMGNRAGRGTRREDLLWADTK